MSNASNPWEKVVDRVGSELQRAASARTWSQGISLLESGDYGLATRKFRDLVSFDPSQGPRLKQLLREKLAKGKQEQALALGQAGGPQWIEDVQLLQALAQVACRFDLPSLAINCLTRACKLAPGQKRLIFAKALLKAGRNEFAPETAEAELAELLNQTRPVLPFFLGQLDFVSAQCRVRGLNPAVREDQLELLNQLKAEAQKYRDGLHADWSQVNANLALLALHLGKGELALQTLEDMDSKKSSFEGLQGLLAVALYQVGLKDSAIDLLRLQTEVDPEHPYHWLNLGLMQMWENNLDDGYYHLILASRKLQELGLTKIPTQLPARAAEYYRSGDWGHAYLDYLYLETHIADPGLTLMVAECQIRLERWEEAIDRLERLLTLAAYRERVEARLRNLRPLLLERAQSLIRMNRRQTAVTCLEQAVRIAKDAKSLQHLYQCYEKLNQPRRSETAYQAYKLEREREEMERLKAEAAKLAQKGLDSMQQQKIQDAMRYLENSLFWYKSDQCFQLLKTLYVKYNQPKSLGDLMKSWERVRESDAKRETGKPEALLQSLLTLPVSIGEPG